MIFIPLCLGMLLPQLHVLNLPPWNLIRYLLMIMLFLSSLQLQIQSLKLEKEHFLLLLANFFMGILPYFLIRLLWPEEKDLALAAFFCGIAPAATASPVVISFLNGHVGFALTGFLLSNLFIAVCLTFLLPCLTGNSTENLTISVAQSLLLVLVLPLTLAQVVRRLSPTVVNWPKHHKNITFLLWSVALVIIGAMNRKYFMDHPADLLEVFLKNGTAALLICLANFYLGGLLGRKKFRRETSQLLGQKNTVLMLYLALTFAGEGTTPGLICYILFHNCINGVQFFLYDKHRRKQNC